MFDTFLKWFVKQTNPRVVSHVTLGILILVGIILAFMIEKWIDWFSVYGFFITLFGFCYVLYDLFRTREVAEIEHTAYGKAKEHVVSEHYRFFLVKASNLVTEIELRVFHNEWHLARVRISDLSSTATYLSRIRPDVTGRWLSYSGKLEEFRTAFEDATNGKNFDYNFGEWGNLLHLLRTLLDSELSPFFVKEEAS